MQENNPQASINSVIRKLGNALGEGDVEAVVKLFQDDCYWRDLVTFTWNIRTLEGRDDIREMLMQQLAVIKPGTFLQDSNESASESDGVTEGWFTFETEAARGCGHIRLKDGLIWTLLTTMSELKGHEEPRGFRRPLGVTHGSERNRKNWKETRETESAELGFSEQPYVVIIGGGHAGIVLGARLRQLNVPTLIIEKEDRPGDGWRKRYKTLCLHDPVWYYHMPYIPFPDNWPVFAPKDKFADWLEMYAKVMELNYWNSTTCESASYDEDTGEWTVVVKRNGREISLKPKQLVLATGMSGKVNMPKIKGQDVFKGEQQHSSRHPGPDGYRGKKVVVVGSNNSAHDICAALWEGGADVTMLQRSSTLVVKSEAVTELVLGDLYSERAVSAGLTTDKADMLLASIPYRIMHEFHMPVYDAIRKKDADFYQRLEKAGFMLDFGDDDSGQFMKYLRRGSGYYIDVGASELIADGRIKLASGVNIRELSESGVVLADGRELPADLIVYATGYGSMNGWAADLISQNVADKVGKCWGLGSATTRDPGPWEGEQRNMWKPTQQEGLWFHGGNLHQTRHYSLYLSLQIKARKEAIPTPVYDIQKTHHLS